MLNEIFDDERKSVLRILIAKDKILTFPKHNVRKYKSTEKYQNEDFKVKGYRTTDFLITKK